MCIRIKLKQDRGSCKLRVRRRLRPQNLLDNAIEGSVSCNKQTDYKSRAFVSADAPFACSFGPSLRYLRCPAVLTYIRVRSAPRQLDASSWHQNSGAKAGACSFEPFLRYLHCPALLTYGGYAPLLGSSAP